MAGLQLCFIIITIIFRHLILLAFVSAETYYITPAPNITCPNENVTCLTLTEYAQQSLETVPSSNITLTFAPGIHHLSSNLHIEDVNSLILQVANSTTSLLVATFTCINSGFMFENISEVSISGLEFNGCRENTVRSVDLFRLDSSRFHNGHGIELEMINNATIERSAFDSLTGRVTEKTYWWWKNSLRAKIGGAIVTRNSTVVINDCQFDGNMADNGGSIYSQNSDVEINTSNFTNNEADYSGGATYTDKGSITIQHSVFINHTAQYGGVIDTTYGTHINIKDNMCINNRADYGGVIGADSGIIIIQDSLFTDNIADRDGGVINNFKDAIIIIQDSLFISNRANHGSGGVIEAITTTITIHNSIFINNSLAKWYGGVIDTGSGTITIYDSIFINNTAFSGSVIYARSGSSIFIHNSTYTNNTAQGGGGVIYSDTSTITIHDSKFIDNTAYHGGVLMNIDAGIDDLHAFITIHDGTFINNRAERDSGVIYVQGGNIVVHNSNFTNNRAGNNGGVVFAFIGTIITIHDSTFSNNTADSGGGVIDTPYSTSITAYNCTFTNNTADNGGALKATRGNILINNCIFNNNTACIQGGAIWMNSTTLTINGYLQITNREAAMEIVFTTSSTLLFSGIVHLSNSYHGSQYHLIMAETNVTFDGSMSLNNTYYDFTAIEKAETLVTALLQQSTLNITFRGSNVLPYNKLYKGPLASSFTTLNRIFIYIFTDSTIYIPLSNDTALFSGGECYYLCELNFGIPSTDNKSIHNGITSLITSSKLRFSKAFSEPVHLYFCKNGKHDYNYPPPATIQVKKGRVFKLSLVAVDQDGNVIPHTVSAFLLSRDGRLGERQALQSTDFACKEFEYTIFSPHDSEQLALNSLTPCTNIAISQLEINIDFLPCDCPVGFVVSSQEQSNCACDCDPDIYSEYITSCSYANKSVQRKDNEWISYINTSDQEGYLIHSHCPFDYCRLSTEQVWINLNVPNGADAQCAFNRSGKLCGSCEDGLSLSFGSSHCKPCSNNWLALLIVFAIAGVALVAFILVCNLTVAVGTINGLIFYANVIAANRAIFLPFDKPNVLTIFIAWLNLDFGFETCFYNGMDGYVKTWLQLAFPLYIISLVVAIIVISDYSGKFAALFTKGKDPVATLATLILLSYTNLIRTIIASLSFTTIKYLADNSHELVWLTDANVPYLKGKHIPLFITALAIVIIAMVYASLLFGWQWINMLCPNVWITKNAKLNIFMDTCHNPYNKDHRYWVGLLLLVRVLLYLVSAVNVLGDPHINLLSINSAVVILFLPQVFPQQNITKRKPILTLENIALLNLISFTSITLGITEGTESQVVVACISTSIAFITFLAILMYHACEFVLKRPFQTIKSRFTKFNCHVPVIQFNPDAYAPTHNMHDNEEVSVTEINALPELADTLTDDEQLESLSDEETEPTKERDTEPDNKDTRHCIHSNSPDGCSTLIKPSGDHASIISVSINEPLELSTLPPYEENNDLMWGDEYTPLLAQY